MTGETPEQCPVCGHEYSEREQYNSQAELRVPTHSGVCVQRFGTKLDVYLHKKLTIELEDARQQAVDSLLSGGERVGLGAGRRRRP